MVTVFSRLVRPIVNRPGRGDSDNVDARLPSQAYGFGTRPPFSSKAVGGESWPGPSASSLDSIASRSVAVSSVERALEAAGWSLVLLLVPLGLVAPS